MKSIALLLTLVVLYVALLVPLTGHIQKKPFLEKVGYVPQPFLLRTLAADQRHLLAAGLMFKVLIYYGNLVEKKRINAIAPPDVSAMRSILFAASRLDPYNMDTYYFAQSLIWDAAKIKETVELLEYGMRYREWDFYLPFFAGFDYAFFLKNYSAAAGHYARAAKLSGSDLFMRLASRYLYETNQTEVAINYLATMIKSNHNQAIKHSLGMRYDALVAVRRIELARERFRMQFGRLPATIEELRSTGILMGPLVDPYGGTFFLDPHGIVRSTSKFAGNEETKSK